MGESQMTVNSTMQTHPLNCNWCIWTHLPHDTDWSLNSYTNLFTCKTLEEAIAISTKLRQQGENVSVFFGKPGKAFDYAKSYGIKKILFISINFNSLNR